MRALPAGLVAALILLAGCADSPGAANPQLPARPATMAIVGLVQDETFAPIAGAQVSIRLVGLSTVTDASGGFRFEGLAVSAYLVDVEAPGYQPATLTAEPTEGNASLAFVLSRPPSLLPRTELVHFRGILQCAAEALIISPSCDSALTAAGGPALFNDTSRFGLGLLPNWGSVVVDVDFDPGSHPGLDGLRLTVRGARDDGGGGDYEQYGRFTGPGPFTAVVEPGQEYPDGSGPVPPETTLLRLEVYPQSHGWHATCEAACFLGVGAALDVSFDLYVTVFYNQRAPAGYSLLEG